MADPRFHDKSNSINAFEVSNDDPEFLRPREFTFLFFTAAQPRVRLLFDKHENYQQGTIQFSELALSAGDFTKRLCVQCKQPLSSPTNCCVATNQGQVVATVHESCFRTWFNSSDKGQISPYRLVRTRRRKLAIEGSSFKVQINNGAPVEEYTFSALQSVELSELSEDPMTGTIVQQPTSGFTGTPPQGVDASDFMRHMQTMVHGNERPSAAEQAQAWQGGAAPAAGTAAPMMSHSIRVEAQCPHCSARLVVTLETKND